MIPPDLRKAVERAVEKILDAPNALSAPDDWVSIILAELSSLPSAAAGAQEMQRPMTLADGTPLMGPITNPGLAHPLPQPVEADGKEK